MRSLFLLPSTVCYTGVFREYPESGCVKGHHFPPLLNIYLHLTFKLVCMYVHMLHAHASLKRYAAEWGLKSAWEQELALRQGWPARISAELTRVGVAVKLTVFGQTVLELLTHSGLASGQKTVWTRSFVLQELPPRVVSSGSFGSRAQLPTSFRTNS